jgi:hypothetical protein
MDLNSRLNWLYCESTSRFTKNRESDCDERRSSEKFRRAGLLPASGCHRRFSVLERGEPQQRHPAARFQLWTHFSRRFEANLLNRWVGC